MLAHTRGNFAGHGKQMNHRKLNRIQVKPLAKTRVVVIENLLPALHDPTCFNMEEDPSYKSTEASAKPSSDSESVRRWISRTADG